MWKYCRMSSWIRPITSCNSTYRNKALFYSLKVQFPQNRTGPACGSCTRRTSIREGDSSTLWKFPAYAHSSKSKMRKQATNPQIISHCSPIRPLIMLFFLLFFPCAFWYSEHHIYMNIITRGLDLRCAEGSGRTARLLFILYQRK